MATKVVLLSALGLAEDGRIYITKTEDALYQVDSSCHITVEAGVNAKFMDSLASGEVELISKEESVVTYYVVDSKNTTRNFTVSGEFLMNEISIESSMETMNISLVLENASANVKNLCILAKEKSTFAQRIDHMVQSSISNIQNVGVAMNGAKLVFDTTGKIEHGMSKTKCSQLSRGIVMDNESEITAKPILLIDEFDCFANHGASIGKMSDEDLFYLMSRGLSKKEAFLLILQGIVRPFIDAIPVEDVKERISSEIEKRIGE